MERSDFKQKLVDEEKGKLNHKDEPANNQGELYCTIQKIILKYEAELSGCKSVDFGATVAYTVRVLMKMHFEFLEWLDENAITLIGTPLQNLETAIEDLKKVGSSIFHSKIMKINIPQIQYLQYMLETAQQVHIDEFSLLLSQVKLSSSVQS